MSFSGQDRRDFLKLLGRGAAIYGGVTKRDLTSLGGILFMAGDKTRKTIHLVVDGQVIDHFFVNVLSAGLGGLVGATLFPTPTR